MRNPTLLLLGSLVLLPSCTSPPPELTPDAREAIAAEVEANVASLMEAMNTHDGQAVLGHYVQSDDFTYVGLTDMAVGFQPFARRVTPWYMANEDVTFDYEIVRTQVLAFDAALVTMRGSSTDTPALTWTQVHVRGEDGSWKILHEHESWGESAMDRPHPMTGS